MRKVLLLTLAMLASLVVSKDAAPPKDLAAATKALTDDTAAAAKALTAFTAEATKEKDNKDVKAAKEALDKLVLKKDATDAEKKKYAEDKAPLYKAWGEAVDKAAKGTKFADLEKATAAVTAAKAAVEGFYCDASKLEFPLFTEKDCTKAATGDAQKLPAGFTDAVTEGLKTPAKACVKTTAVKDVKSIKVTCELKDKKAAVTVAAFKDDACATAADKPATATLTEGTCAENTAVPTTWVKIGPKAAAAAEEGGGVGMYILIVVVVLVVCVAGYFIKTKYFGPKGE